jgi:hypothetical protein
MMPTTYGSGTLINPSGELDVTNKNIAGIYAKLQTDNVPGDGKSFLNPKENPDPNSDSSVGNENTLFLGGGEYYAHPFGIETEEGLKFWGYVPRESLLPDRYLTSWVVRWPVP